VVPVHGEASRPCRPRHLTAAAAAASSDEFSIVMQQQQQQQQLATFDGDVVVILPSRLKMK
jgi:hypothetical protein